MADQQFKLRHLQDPWEIDYTPTVDVAAGVPVAQGSLVGITKRAILANVLGAIAIRGIYEGVKITGALAAGVPLWWDPAGNPVGGTAGTGAITGTVGALTIFLGYSTHAAASGDAIVRFVQVQRSPVNL